VVTAFRTQLEPPALETEFRADGLASDKRVTAGLVAAAIAFLIIRTVSTTLALTGDVQRLHLLWTIRAFDLTVAAIALFLVRRVDRPRSYDVIVSWWIGLWFAAIVSENAIPYAGLTDNVVWDVFLVIAVYAALSLPLSRQAALAAMLSGGDLLVLWKTKSPDASFDMVDTILAFACANVVGAFVSRKLSQGHRRAFLALRHEVAAKKALEAALREIKTLQGIIPICSYCKNIRTDVGDWQRVEAYVQTHSDAQFSHGICPACVQLHFPEFVDE
jgi:hypothetical protein